MKPKQKMVEIIKFKVKTTQEDIESGECGLPSRCMEKVAIERALRLKDPGIDHKVQIDGGKIRFSLWGWKWIAHTPRIAKASLVRFDKERLAREKASKSGETWCSKVQPHEYTVEAEKLRPIVPITKRDRARLDQINVARAKREEKTGVKDRQKYRLKYRVEGMHPNV